VEKVASSEWIRNIRMREIALKKSEGKIVVGDTDIHGRNMLERFKINMDMSTEYMEQIHFLRTGAYSDLL
jgi:hypothetical protein